MRFTSFLPAFQLATPISLSRTHQSFVTPLYSLHKPLHTRVHKRAPYTTMVTSLPSPTTHPRSLAGVNPVFAQCMLRINNPTASKEFYSKLGMKFLTQIDLPDFKFSLFFFAYSDVSTPPLSDPQPDRAKWLWARPEPTIELTWNWPADTYEESLKLAEGGNKTEEYVSGNQQPMGFGYIEIAVNDVGSAVAGLKGDGVTVVDEGVSGDQSYATVVDPDGYHVRISGPSGGDTAKVMTQVDAVFDSVMLRVKDPRSAIPFFEHLGFQYVTRVDKKDENMTEYYLAYTKKTDGDEENVRKMRECKIKLVHLWGTENENEQMYTNGNVKPQRGFGHVGIIVDDIYKTMDRLAEEGYKTVRKAGPFGDVGELGFIEEPSTSYWVEIIKREGQAANVPYEQPVLG